MSSCRSRRRRGGDGAGDRNAAEQAQPSILGGFEKILVIEDDPRVRRVAVSRLIDAGYDVVEAADGHQALARLEENPDISAFSPGNRSFNESVADGSIREAEASVRPHRRLAKRPWTAP